MTTNILNTRDPGKIRLDVSNGYDRNRRGYLTDKGWQLPFCVVDRDTVIARCFNVNAALTIADALNADIPEGELQRHYVDMAPGAEHLASIPYKRGYQLPTAVDVTKQEAVPGDPDFYWGDQHNDPFWA